ncbi:MAG: GGDEF domain-containing protein [Clostridiales bacterium]|nr:GGDEF domain-containing protein [Clostridiales bacterium]HBM80380.1 diguanylate cyclase [Clostridiaceae bacterium]
MNSTLFNTSEDETSKEFLSITAEFKDKNLEKEFMDYEMSNSIKYIRSLFLGLGIFYFLFIIPEYFLIKSLNIFILLVINRVVLMVMVCTFYIKLKYAKESLSIYHSISALESTGSVFILANCFIYESPNFFILSFGIVVLLLTFCLIPNKWSNVAGISIMTSVFFLLISYLYFRQVSLYEFSAILLYLTLVTIFVIITSYKTNRYARIQYINNRALLMLSITDPLTGIYNRLKFNEELKRNINLSKRYNLNLSLLLLDIDDFKIVNDSYGHLKGDKILTEMTGLINDSIRETDIFARWGGEEFVILLPATPHNKALEFGERLKRLISEHEFSDIGHVTCSFGVVSLKKEDDMNSLLQRVDKLLYTAKERGKNCVVNQ